MNLQKRRKDSSTQYAALVWREEREEVVLASCGVCLTFISCLCLGEMVISKPIRSLAHDLAILVLNAKKERNTMTYPSTIHIS